MQPLSRDSLAANAYRTLGLSASATQAAIDEAARRMRIWPDERRIPPTPWDVAWMGPVSRSRGEIERAVSALNEPGSRVEQRLLWYHASAPAGDPAGAAAGDAAAVAASPLPARHDDVLRALHAAYVNDPEVTDAAQWRRVVEGVSGLAASPEYAAWMARVEEQGDFEKRASAAELYAAVDALPGAVVAALVPKAHAALERDDPDACADIAQILRAAGGRGGASSPVRLLLDRLEDALDQQCREMDYELRDKLRTDRQQPDAFYPGNREACHAAATFYNEQVAVALARFCALADDDPDRVARSRSRCAQVLALLAMGWEWAGRFAKAEQTQRVALGLVEGLAGEAGIRKDLQRYEALAAQERDAAAGWAGLEQRSALAPEPKRPPRAAQWRPAGQKSKSGVSGVAFAALAVMLVRVVMMVATSGGGGSYGGSSGGGSTTNYQPPVLWDLKRENRPGSSPPRPGALDPGLRSIFTPPAPIPKAYRDPRFNLDPSPPPAAAGPGSPPARSGAAPPRPRVDPALVNDPLGEFSREQ